MFMRISTAALVAALSTAGAFAGQSQSIELAQSSGNFQGNTESYTRPANPGPRPRPDRYYCILKSGSYCSVREQRVGGVCRCPNQTGSGRVVVQ